MDDSTTEHQNPWRYFYLGWFLFALGTGFVNMTNIVMESMRYGLPLILWRPIVTEYTGTLSLFLLIPVIKWFDERFLFTRREWKLPLLAHVLFTIPFSMVHSAMFTLERKLLYPLFGSHYDFGALGFELLYEYRKITVGYVLVVFSLYGFRHYLQLQRLLDLPDAHEAEGNAEVVETEPKQFLRRLLAQRNDREVIIDTDSINYLEAAGNYVVLHTTDGQFKVRTTLSAIEAQLDPQDFVRVHRSYIVNIDAMKEIQPWFRGDQRIVMNDGVVINLSRRYRNQFTQLANLMVPQEKVS